MDKFKEKTLETEKIFSGKVVNLQVDKVLLPDGNTATRELIKHPGAVAVIALNNDHKIVFVKQYRKPCERSLVEIPAGKLEPGEDPVQAAKRELEEETGYQAKELEYVTSFYSSPGFADELLHIYLATDIEKATHPLQGDADEFIEILELTLQQAKQYVAQQKICDAKTNYAVLYMELAEMRKSL
ncbi:NUDIX hydrolase [Virgibacillus sp. 179-BFC.A HS]|uniref:NUDIX hydrolase n=1 Tax=Tigheibacillus jepli TaxID=3035914 RepID=A0ABU5CH15_9BACI|nr:NUDIX hydrolase [Virgibacillus sp. 179-BFC.A HS]MDY0405643.1 NUDIX hydrolase [Virgibacillus sp. 179-BFC.A HS]